MSNNQEIKKGLLAGNIFMFNMKTSSSGLMAYLPMSVTKGRVVGIPIFGDTITKSLNAAKAEPAATINAVAIKAEGMTFIFSHGYKYIIEAVEQAETKVKKLVDEKIMSDINQLEKEYRGRVKDALDMEKLDDDERKKVEQQMWNKFPAAGPTVRFSPCIFAMPENTENADPAIGVALSQSKENLDAQVYKAFLGDRLKKLFDIGATIEKRLLTKGNIHSSSIKSAKGAYAQMAAEVQAIDVPLLTEALEAFKVVIVDHQDNLGAAYCHFLNSGIYLAATQLGVASAINTGDIGSPEDLLIAASDMSLEELMDNVKEG